jgi:protein-S-isoprenylcysteine O-methyltransferase Ste14
MHLIGEPALGLLILVLMGAMVGVKRLATGSVLDERPDARPLVRSVNAFNLAFLLVVNPAAAVLLLAGRLEAWDVTRVAIAPGWLRTSVEALGIASYAAGAALMMWALLTLRAAYQLGGMSPRSQDALVTAGPYARIRHPMYAAALAMALGLALALHSLLCLGVFAVYLVLLSRLMPLEDEGLRTAYGEPYERYARAVPRLVPVRVRKTEELLPFR